MAAAAVQQVEGRSGRLRAVVAEDAVAEERRVLGLAEVLDRDAAAARARVVAGDLDILNRRIGARVDLDAAAVGVEESRLADVVRFDRRLLAGAGGEVVGAGDLESAQHGLARHPVAEVDDVVDHSGMARRVRVGDVGVGGGEHDLADRFERNPVVPRVEPDQRLAPGRRAVGAGMDVDRLVDRIARRPLPARPGSGPWDRRGSCPLPDRT